MRKILLLIVLNCLSAAVFAQTNYWKQTGDAPKGKNLFEQTKSQKPASYKIFELDEQSFRTVVNKAPSENDIAVARSQTIVSFPMPDGTIEHFRVVSAPVMHPLLSAKYPGINAYAGSGIENPSSVIRFDVSPYGMNAIILSGNRPSIYIDHMVDNYYRVVSRKDMVDYKKHFKCETPDEINPLTQGNGTRNADDGKLRVYRLAMISGGEFSQHFLDGTEINDAQRKAKVLAAQNSHVVRSNAVYERDFGIRMVLVPNNDLIIYLDPATDPIANPNSPSGITMQATIDGIIGPANYDIGHTESKGNNNGNAGCIGCVCVNGSKGRAWTVYSNPSLLEFFVIDYLTHEMGHQFGGNHTFSFTTEGTGVNVEPGSGSTIMGYAGITGATDVQPNSDEFFHVRSIEQITNYIKGATGGSCAQVTNTGNNTPVVNAGADFTIPISTPFMLTGTGTDADPTDVLTFNWEQNDNRTSGPGTPNPTSTTGPMFRNYLPTTSPVRMFPALQYILSGANGFQWEQLPSVTRALNFRFIAKDNRPGGGSNKTDDMVVNVTNTSGPFLITSQNTSGISYNSGSSQTITWSVNNTTAAPVSCANVIIELSTNGGTTFPIVLAASTANDGSEVVAIPNNPTTQARIRVRALGNIFFDINNSNFTIVAASPDFDFASPAPATITCGGAASASINLATTSVLGYSTPITLSAIAGVPPGTTVNFSTNPVNPGSASNVTLTNTNTLTPGNYNITIQGVSGAITKTRVLTFIVQPGDGPTVNTNPASQALCAGSNVTFSAAATGALSQIWQVSTDGGATFTNIAGATGTSYTINGITAALNNNRYRCVFTGQCNTSNSNAAVLTVQLAPSISTQPANTNVCAGSNASFSVTAAGTGIAYQWQLSTNGGISYNNIPGATNASIAVNAVTTAQNSHRYRCIVSGTCTPSAISGAGILNVTSPVTINTQPADVVLCGNGDASFTINAINTNNGIQWQVSTDGGTTYSNIAGATSTTLTVNVTGTNFNNNRYRVVLNNGVCPVVNSSAALLTVNAKPSVILSAAPYTKVFPGLRTTLTANIIPAGGAIQWQKNGTNINNTSNTLSNIGVDDLGDYKVIVTTASGCFGESNVLSVLDSATSKIFFYPNPNQGQFQVRYNNPQGAGTQNYIRVFDSKGAKVFEQLYSVSRPYSQMFVDLRRRSTGIYMVELTDKNGKRLATGKVYIQ